MSGDGQEETSVRELGGIVRRITPEGFLSMQMVGGWLDQALLRQCWVILGSKGTVDAVTGIRDIHVLPQDERNKIFPRNDIFLDVGAKDAAGQQPAAKRTARNYAAEPWR